MFNVRLVSCAMCNRDDMYVYYVGEDETLCQDCAVVAEVSDTPVDITFNSGLVAAN